MGDAPARRGAVAGVVVFAALALATTAFAATSGSWTGLASGRIGEYLWSVKTKRQGGPAGEGSEGAQRPCLLVGTTWQTGPYSYRRTKYRSCVDPLRRIAAGEPPLIAAAVQPQSGDPVKMTAVGMIFAGAARRARVTLSDGSQSTVALQPLTASKAHAAALGHLRYAAFGVHGRWCPSRIVSLNAGGRVLWDSGPDAFTCGVEAPVLRSDG